LYHNDEIAVKHASEVLCTSSLYEFAVITAV